jgi:hypothetical protein
VQADASGSSSSSGCSVAGNGEAHAIVTFQVSGSAVSYSLSASSSGPAGSGCGYKDGGALLTLTNGAVIRTTSGQGVLGPGFYRLHALARAGACSPQGGSFSGNGSATLDFGP